VRRFGVIIAAKSAVIFGGDGGLHPDKFKTQQNALCDVWPGSFHKNDRLRQPSLSVYFPYRMDFEYDPIKSQTNKEKHGIDFDEAQALWLDEDRLEFPARSDTEQRHALLALKDGKIWVAFYTLRESAIRIISVRRARENEEKTYYDS